MVHTVYFSNMESLPELGLIISICSQIRIIFFPLQVKIVHIYVCLLCMLVIIVVLWSPSVYFPKTSRTSPHYPRDKTHTFICSPGMLKRWKFGCTFSSPPCGGLCWLLLWPWFYFRVIFRQNQSRLVPACASQLLPNNWLVWSQVTVPGFNAIKLPPKNFQSPTSNTSRRGEIVGRPRSFFLQTNPPPSKENLNLTPNCISLLAAVTFRCFDSFGCFETSERFWKHLNRWWE